MNIDLEKKYIQDIEKKVRNLEIEKVKLEQQKEYTEKAIQESLNKMKELGYTPETIGQGIQKLENNIAKLKSKINSILKIENENGEEDEHLLF